MIIRLVLADHLGEAVIGCHNVVMNEREQLRAFPLVPVYRQDSPNAPIDLGTTLVSMSEDRTNLSVGSQCSFGVQLTRERLEIRVPSTTGKPLLRRAFQAVDDGGTELTFVESGDSVSAMISGVDEGAGRLLPLEFPVVARRKSAPMKRAIFHLVNWPRFSGPEDFVLITGNPPYYGLRTCGRVSLKVCGWSIMIIEVDNAGPLLKELKAKGGYAITHVGLIERNNGATYLYEDIDKLLAALGSFFSFALARWAGPQLQVGYDASGTRT